MEKVKCKREGCNKTFETHDRRRKYCSNLCAALVVRERQLEYSTKRQKLLRDTLKSVKPYEG